MFTPPPSPRPSVSRKHDSSSPTPCHDDYHHPPASSSSSSDKIPIYSTLPEFSSNERRKQMIGKKTRWAVLLVPLVLVFLTVSTRLFTHPVAFDIFSAGQHSRNWRTWTSTASDWRPHKRHPDPQADNPNNSLWATTETLSSSSSSPQGSSPNVPQGSSPSSPTASSGSIAFPTGSPSGASGMTTTTSALPSIPTIPSQAPVLPTPFPQPLDTSLQNNFSSASCYSFINNMTNTLPFRSCRPFSLLVQSSSDFLQAQRNVTLLNAILWGTCNTLTSQSQCISNMAWFASTLQSACANDLQDRNAMAANTLIGLQAYQLMLNTGCLADPTTNTYCFIDSVVNPNPSDLYYYQLPLGISLPKSTSSSCSGCMKSLLGIYDAALRNSTEADNLSALQKTYGSAATLARTQCGQGFATTTAAAGSRVGIRLASRDGLLWTAFVFQGSLLFYLL
jgi:hypothetical protein